MLRSLVACHSDVVNMAMTGVHHMRGTETGGCCLVCMPVWMLPHHQEHRDDMAHVNNCKQIESQNWWVGLVARCRRGTTHGCTSACFGFLPEGPGGATCLGSATLSCSPPTLGHQPHTQMSICQYVAAAGTELLHVVQVQLNPQPGRLAWSHKHHTFSAQVHSPATTAWPECTWPGGEEARRHQGGAASRVVYNIAEVGVHAGVGGKSYATLQRGTTTCAA